MPQFSPTLQVLAKQVESVQISTPNKSLSLPQLPTVVLYQIIDLLDWVAIVSLRLSCHNFAEVINDVELLRQKKKHTLRLLAEERALHDLSGGMSSSLHPLCK